MLLKNKIKQSIDKLQKRKNLKLDTMKGVLFNVMLYNVIHYVLYNCIIFTQFILLQ